MSTHNANAAFDFEGASHAQEEPRSALAPAPVVDEERQALVDALEGEGFSVEYRANGGSGQGFYGEGPGTALGAAFASESAAWEGLLVRTARIKPGVTLLASKEFGDIPHPDTVLPDGTLGTVTTRQRVEVRWMGNEATAAGAGYQVFSVARDYLPDGEGRDVRQHSLGFANAPTGFRTANQATRAAHDLLKGHGLAPSQVRLHEAAGERPQSMAHDLASANNAAQHGMPDGAHATSAMPIRNGGGRPGDDTAKPKAKVKGGKEHDAARREERTMKTNESIKKLIGRVIEEWKKGNVRPWVRPWVDGAPDAYQGPLNASTDGRYSGGNRLLLDLVASLDYYKPGEPLDNRWLTVKQAAALGGALIEGRDSHGVGLLKILTQSQQKPKQDEQAEDNPQNDGQTKRVGHRPSGAYPFTVYHVSEFTGLDLPPLPAPTVRGPVELTENQLPLRVQDIRDFLIEKTGLSVTHRGNQAFYAPGPDAIVMPRPEQFTQPMAYADTLLHEIGHCAGAKHRAGGKKEHKRFGDSEYAREELVAEFTSVFLGDGLPAAEERLAAHVDYMGSWIKALEENPNEFFTAAREAEKRSTYLREGGLVHQQEREATLQATQEAERGAIVSAATPTPATAIPVAADREGQTPATPSEPSASAARPAREQPIAQRAAGGRGM